MKRLALLFVLLPALVGAQDHPKFFITPEREAAWAHMKSDYEANPTAPATHGGRMYKLIKDNADLVDGRYGDVGAWATLMYHFTGDPAYVARAWTRILDFINKTDVTCTNGGISGNFCREYFIQYAWMYDWLYPGLDAAQRTAFLDRINLMAACVNAPAPAAQYGLGGDSDQTTGEYLGMAMWYTATSSYNPAVVALWNSPTVMIGGYDATASDFSTYRNSIYKYVTEASAGGEWLEGYEYNLGTVKLLMVGTDALKTALGVDHFPEVTAWQQEAALQYIHTLSPNSASMTGVQPYLWGDTQSPRQYRGYYYYETALVYAGVTKGTAAGPIIQDWVLDREEASTVFALDPFPRGFLMFDPYATRGDWTTLPVRRYVSGRQMLNARTGWGSPDSWFMAYYPPRAIADHPTNYWGEFQLFKNGKWAFTHPQSYGGTSIDSRGSNGLSLSGVSAWTYAVQEFRAAMATRSQSSIVNFEYIVGSSGGSLWPNHRYAGCASYAMEHTRSMIWLKDWDVIVVYDRANSKAPTFPTASLSATFKTWSLSRPWKELYVHTNVSPDQVGNYTDWVYDPASSAHARVTHLLPASSTKTVEDETVLYDPDVYYSTGTIRPEEMKYHVRIVPTATNQWETFLNVWDAYGTSVPSTVALVEDVANRAQGTLVTRDSTNFLAMFNAIQGPDVPSPAHVGGGFYDYVTAEPTTATILGKVRLRQSGYTVQFAAAGGSTTKLALFDLDPIATWEYQINGGAAVPLTVDAAGSAVAETSVTGTVTLTLTSDVPPPPPPVIVETTGLPDGSPGVPYSAPIAVSGGNGGPYACTLDSGTLPTGLSVAPACATGITGTPGAPPAANSLIKTAATGWGNAGAYSSNSLAAGDGYVEWVATEVTTGRMLGLSVGNVGNNYTDIDFAIHAKETGALNVYENGGWKHSGSTYSAGDVLRVQVEGGVVKYKKNGVAIYTSLIAPSYPLLADAAFNHNGATINNAMFDDGGGADPVAWASMTGVNLLGSTPAPFTIEACDSTPLCGTRSLTLTLRSTPTITTSTLDVGTVGAAYSDTVVAAGGAAPYTYTVESGSLPPGLSLAAATGVISGTPTTLGTYGFVVRVTDNAAEIDDASFQVTINQDPALVNMSIWAQPGSNSAVVHFSVAGLPVGTCEVYLKESEATLQTELSEGGASRSVTFTGLVPAKTYGVEVLCGTAQSERAYFTTTAPPSGEIVVWKITMRPHAKLVARGASAVRVTYDTVPSSFPQNVDQACVAGCVSNLPLVSGRSYTVQFFWRDAVDDVVASSRPWLVAVP
jgi:hypothetical protein